METVTTPNFQIQFDPAEFTPSGELAAIRQRVQVMANACESDMSTLAVWFGIVVSDKFGSSNRVIVTLTKNVRGASNTGFSSHNSQMRVNPEFGASDDLVLGLFVAELSEIFMNLAKWNPGDSSGEGLSRVSAELLHPGYAPQGVDNYVNAWLASDPTTDPTSAIADDSFRKDWISQTFTGGPLRAGGNVNGDDDSYSYGCAMLFIYYLKDQLGFSMAQIAQNGAATLDGTYRLLTKSRAGGFSGFKALLDAQFPVGNRKSTTDNPFPSTVLSFIKTSNTPTGHVEVHLASGPHYQDRILETPTTFANESDGTWQLLPNLDLAFIKTSNTPNGHVEVHIASRSSNYQSRILETPTTFANESDGAWSIVAL